MMSSTRTGRFLAVAVMVLACVAVTSSQDADACGVPRGGDKPPPYLAEELVLNDDDGEVEHFVREFRFAGADEHFGFVVPTPTRPKVAKVEKSPFPALRRAFPYVAPREVARTSQEDDDEPWRDDGPHGRIGRVAIGGGARGSDRNGVVPGVTLLDAQKVGAFTAFVLQADDACALGGWLATNGLKTSPSVGVGGAVARKFFFAVFRYEKPPGGATTSAPRTSRWRRMTLLHAASSGRLRKELEPGGKGEHCKPI